MINNVPNEIMLYIFTFIPLLYLEKVQCLNTSFNNLFNMYKSNNDKYKYKIDIYGILHHHNCEKLTFNIQCCYHNEYPPPSLFNEMYLGYYLAKNFSTEKVEELLYINSKYKRYVSNDIIYDIERVKRIKENAKYSMTKELHELIVGVNTRLITALSVTPTNKLMILTNDDTDHLLSLHQGNMLEAFMNNILLKDDYWALLMTFKEGDINRLVIGQYGHKVIICNKSARCFKLIKDLFGEEAILKNINITSNEKSFIDYMKQQPSIRAIIHFLIDRNMIPNLQ